MRMNSWLTTLSAAAITLSGCGGSAPEEAKPAAASAPVQSAPVNVHLTMLTKVIPQSDAFWELTGNAQNDAGEIDAAKFDDAAWAKLLEAGKVLEDAGRSLATSSTFLATVAGTQLQNEESPGAPKAADVQRAIDAKPDEFRRHGADLQLTGASIVAAIEKRDTTALGQVSSALYNTCVNCHKAFWYPEQKQPAQ